MNQGKYIFNQLTDFLPQRVLDRLVEKYYGNKYVKFFSCRNQLSCMLFGQISGRESLRDLMIGLEAHKSKFYHLGFGKNVTRSNLAKANERRNYKIFEEFAYHLISEARRVTAIKDFNLNIKSNVYAFDLSTIVEKPDKLTTSSRTKLTTWRRSKLTTKKERFSCLKSKL